MIEKLQEHLEELAAALGCIMEQGQNTPGMMYVEEDPPRIEGPRLVEGTVGTYPDLCSRYYTMLHELGHVHHGHTQGRPPYEDKRFYFENGVLRSEAQAWQYALDQALIIPTRECANFMRFYCIGSYWAGAKAAGGRDGQRLLNGNRHWVSFKYDEPDSFFHAVVERMEAFCR